jgi:nitrile hydratase accessory protein
MPSTDDHMLADLRAQAEGMGGSTALPRRDDGEPVFDQPWQGRAVALAIETVAALGVSWDDFRNRLIAAIDADPQRDYYESWLAALDELVAGHHLASREEIDRHRMAAAGYRTTEDRTDDLEVFPVSADERTLTELLTLIFGDHWRSIRFGTLIPGAVHEITATEPPRTTMLDGYLTIDLGTSHVHLCIGEHRRAPDRPIDPDLARRRRCAHAELQRQWIDGAPRSWMFRMFNGNGDQMMTVLLPNPYLDDTDRMLDEPDWSRLALWDALRARFLDLPPDPVDRSAHRFVHS